MFFSKILLFIPMYNCEKQITRVLSQIDERAVELISEVIIVNNRSTDNSEKAVLQYLSEHEFDIPVRLFRNDENYSLGGSHKVAFDYAIEHSFDYVIVLHGDDQGNLSDLLPYIEKGSALKYDSFLGSRFERNSSLVGYDKFRIFGNMCFNVGLTCLTQHYISDLGSGLNMYKVSYLENKFYKNFPNSLTFNVYMLFYGIYSKSKFRFFPLEWREEDQISNAKFFKQSMEILKLSIEYLSDKDRLFSGAENEFSRIDYTYKEIKKEDVE